MMNSSADKTPLFKFIIIGESGVGKSCLLLRYTKDEFVSEYNVTIGVEFSSKTVEIDQNSKIKLQIWDTAGQESFRSIVRSFYRNVTAVFLVYNITRRETLEKLDGWLKEAKENAAPNIVTVLVGAQNDLDDQRQVSYDEGKSFIDEKGINLFFETSSKNNENVELVLTAKLVFLNYINETIRKNDNKASIALSEQRDNPQQQLQPQKKKKNDDSGCC
ncbi:unnamed protein product (macronuclear) [Paramecium tetraurelia]|uniref:Chromosome undetermined scaffold_46, whole genome shotgun sequence n=1 Tax=Paramecium tetraurelia TaxID=5888 RepID=Q3SDK9_PARTE|nr:uncharacterized protein GSPATT00015734001 [Paramecium tetraurelia]CAI39349.1 rab_B04 [Paramecium tetraurelia]CAK80875.1 unnamed protein product [Paramecium tetraurelia]|eukprot:XP_001448272.1 hypothetical protein (macronuclear) [Paramecium tetraurelia strain d4-2]